MTTPEPIRLRYQFRHSKISIYDAVISPNNRYLFTTNGVYIKQWELATGELVQQFRHDPSISPVPNKTLIDTCLAISPDGRMIAAGKTQSSIGVWQIEPNKFLGYCCDAFEYRWGSDDYHSTKLVAFNEDGTQLMNSNGHSWYMNKPEERIVNGKKTNWWPGTVAPVTQADCMASNADGTLIVTGRVGSLVTSSWHGPPFGVDIIEFAYKAGQRNPPDEGSFISAVAISDDSKYFATGFGNGTITLWRASTNLPVWHIEGHAQPGNNHKRKRLWIEALSFTASNETLISVSYDSRISCWDVKTGKHKYTYEADVPRIAYAAFSSNGHTLVTVDDQTLQCLPERGLVSVWEIGDAIRLHSSVQRKRNTNR